MSVLDHRRQEIAARSNLCNLFAMHAGIFLAQRFAVPAKFEENGLTASQK
jgi:hypothetical protein